jgi:hypothetical protein
VKKYLVSELVMIGIDEVRNYMDATYYLYDKGKYEGEFSRSEIVDYIEKLGFVGRAETVIGAIHNYHGVKIHPQTMEFRGGMVETPDLRTRNPELANRKPEDRRPRIVVDGMPLRFDVTDPRGGWF